jgi:DNA-binding response OmpR family regulator
MYKIFIIEDDEIVLSIYQKKVQAEGYTVETALEAETGYAKISVFKPDLLLLDMMLPGMSGGELLTKLRGEEEFKDLPIVVFSGSDSQDVLDEAKALGATRALSKGEFTPNQIVARITEVLSAIPPSERKDLVLEGSDWSTPKGRVLVVEDDPIIMALVKDIIEDEGYTVVTAADGRQAYQILAKDNSFAAGIFDVNVPYIEGPDLIRHMKTEKRLMSIPVLIMTAEQGLNVQTDSFVAGALLFLPKPFTRALMKTMFHMLVGK